MFAVNVLDSLPLSLVNDALEVFGYLKGTDCFIAGGFAKAFIIEDYTSPLILTCSALTRKTMRLYLVGWTLS
jgi:hypothetical protein